MARFASSSEVKLKYGSLVDRIKNFKQKDWVKASLELGLYIPDVRGTGSHIAVYKSSECPVSDSRCLVVTIQGQIYPQIQRDYIKKLVFEGQRSGKYNEEDVWKALGVKLPKRTE